MCPFCTYFFSAPFDMDDNLDYWAMAGEEV